MADDGTMRMLLKGLGMAALAWYWASRRRRQRTTAAATRSTSELDDSDAELAMDGETIELEVTAPASEGEAPVEDPRAARWLDLLRVGDDEVSRRAEVALEALGVDALPTLERAQHDESLYVREAADRVIERIERTRRRDVAPLVTEPAPEPLPWPEPAPPSEPEEVPATSAPPPLEEADPPEGFGVREEPEQIDVPKEPDDPEPPTLAFEEIRARLRDAASGDAGERDARLAGLVGRAAALRMVVEKVEPTSAYDASPTHRDGRTLVGRLSGGDVVVAVRTSTADAAWADGLDVGTEVHRTARLTRWDRIYDRATFEAEATRGGAGAAAP